MNLPSAARIWLFIIGGALAYDVLAIRREAETLSEWCSKHPKTTYVVGGYLLAHLIGRPQTLKRVDPLRVISSLLRGSIGEMNNESGYVGSDMRSMQNRQA